MRKLRRQVFLAVLAAAAVSAAAVSAAALQAAATFGAAASAEGGNVRLRAPIKGQYRESKRFVMRPEETRIELGVSFIIEGSDAVLLDGENLERGGGYRINILTGTLILVEPPSGGETLEVRWSRYPFAFEPVFAARFPGERPVAGVTVPPATVYEPDRETPPSPYRLRLSGNKTVGFSMGSGKGLGIDQSLKVTMSGKLAPDLEVRAYLSDDNFPVQPQGNTEELTHLDKISVQVISRHTETNLGDFATAQGWSEFARFERELRGAAVKVAARGQEVSAGAGIAKGRYQTVSFFGSDGVQGPYELLPARRFNGVIILPGTETVYLDGHAQRRGSENGYVIDYTRGSITFTERVTISADSEIVVEFQSGEDGYSRSTVTGGWSLPLAGGAAGLDVFLFRESDDPDRPVRAVLSDEDRETLRAAGDDAALAVSAGVRQVEDAMDAYVLVPADSLPERFVFVEAGGGYLVDFYKAGSKQGDYVTDGFTRRGEVKFRYAGPGAGDYRVGKPLPLPQRRQVVTLGLKGERGALFGAVEGNLSDLDRNVLSAVDNDDNRGGAVSARAGVQGLDLAGGALSLRGEFSSLEDRFAAPDKAREAYFYRNWNLEDVPLEGSERIYGGRLDYGQGARWQVSGGYRRLERDDLAAGRGEGSLSIGDLSERGLHLSAFDTRTGELRDRRRGHAEVAFGIWRVLPRVIFDTERYRARGEAAPDSGRFYYQNTFALSRLGAGALRGTVSFTQRRTDVPGESDGPWRRDRENDELRFDGGYSAGPRIVDVVLSRRRTRYISSATSSAFDLARLRYRDAWRSGTVTSDLGYRISSGVDRKVEKAVVFVGENEGDYDRHGSEVGQNRGDYMVIFLPAEEVEAVRSVDLTWRLSLGGGVRSIRPGAAAGGDTWERIKRNVSVDQFVTVTEKSRSDDLLRLYLLDPSLLRRDDVSLFGKNSFRQEWNFLGAVNRYNLRLVLLRENEKDSRTQDMPVKRYNRDVGLRFDAVPAASLSLSFEVGSGLSELDGGFMVGQSYRVERLSGSHTAGWRPRPPVKLALEVGAQKRNDAVSSASQKSFFTTPSLDASVGTNMHLNAFLKLTWTDEESGAGKPLFFLEQGLRQDWNLSGQYRITRFISLGLNYNGRREKDYTGEVRTVHAFKMESRAFF